MLPWVVILPWCGKSGVPMPLPLFGVALRPGAAPKQRLTQAMLKEKAADKAVFFAGHYSINRCRYCVRVAEGADRCVRDLFPATPTVSPVDHVPLFPAELRW
jgi:hypothetical protein